MVCSLANVQNDIGKNCNNAMCYVTNGCSIFVPLIWCSE